MLTKEEVVSITIVALVLIVAYIFVGALDKSQHNEDMKILLHKMELEE
jgi:hypothetical protein